MKAFLHAYDHVNLGDDLFIRTITSRYPAVRFYMFSTAENKKIFADIPNLKVIDKDAKKFERMKKLRPSLIARYQDKLKLKCDAVIYIGGSIFMEYPTWENIVNWWRFQSERYPFYVIGANFGPYQTEEYKEQMKKQFAGLKDICFRDRYSYELFKDNDNTRIAPDILFTLAEEKKVKANKDMIISVINCENRDDLKAYSESYMDYMKKITQKYADEGYNISVVSFCKDEGDETAAERLIEDASVAVNKIYYNGYNYSEILECFRNAGYVVGSRFHATVIGLAFGCDVMPVVYSDKTLNILNDLKYVGDIADIRKPQSYSKFLNIEEASGRLGVPVEQIRAEAEVQFKKLDELLTM